LNCPLISIVMPVYNNEILFPRAVSSVLQQSYKDIELIIVDDGSTDNTPFIADKIAENDDRVRVIHQENQWIYASFNNGIKKAKGEYIYIVNSDDALFENALKILTDNLKQYDYPDVIWTKVIKCECNEDYEEIRQEDLSPKSVMTQYFKNINYEPQYWMDSVIKNNYSVNQANLYKREIMLKHQFRNDVFGADILFNYEIAKDVSSCIVLGEPIYKFNVYKDGNTSRRYYDYINEMYNEQLDVELGFLLSKGISNKENKNYFKKGRRIAFSYECNLILNQEDMTQDEKISEIMKKDYSYMIQTAFDDHDGREEFEARVFSSLRKYFLNNSISKKSEYYFVYKMLCILLSYEKTTEEVEYLKKAVYCKKNPNKIGEYFLKKICK